MTSQAGYRYKGARPVGISDCRQSSRTEKTSLQKGDQGSQKDWHPIEAPHTYGNESVSPLMCSLGPTGSARAPHHAVVQERTRRLPERQGVGRSSGAPAYYVHAHEKQEREDVSSASFNLSRAVKPLCHFCLQILLQELTIGLFCNTVKHLWCRLRSHR